MTLPTNKPKPAPLPVQARKLANVSIAPSTRRAYEGALRRFEHWRRICQYPLDDQSIAIYLTHLFHNGKSPATCALVVAAFEFSTKITGSLNPIGRATKSVLAGIRREGKERGRGQSNALTYEDVIKVLTTCKQRRKHPKKRESLEAAYRRGLVDGALVALAFMAGLRRSEISKLEWRDITLVEDGNLMVHVRYSKTDQEGKAQDFRLLKGDCATALQELRLYRAETNTLSLYDRVINLNGQNINRRIQAACRAAGISTDKLTSHSGRIGLASELTQRGAEITETALAGGWKSTAMVIHYSRRAQVQHGAVAKYF